MRKLAVTVLSALLIGVSVPAMAQSKGFAAATKGTTVKEGFLDLYVNPKTNTVAAALPKGDGKTLLRAIYTMRLTSGLGSNPVGLDRGWGDSGKIVAFRRFGDKVIVEQENMFYRASANNPLEKRAVRESFAPSFLGALKVLAERPDGSVLVDMTDFLTRDGLGLTAHLRDRGQGSFAVKKDRTLPDADNIFSFPDNSELDVFITLSSSKPGSEVATTAANGSDVTLIQHHSFVRLPEEGYTPLISDPRMGAIEETHYDYSAPMDGVIETRFARRYRLQKDANGKTIKPIVFYIDSGAPEPVRSALVDGAKWWEDAFAAAGFPDGYRVELLPENYHPLDVRYNVVQWVHRQTRGWSYGGGVSDPRTGEMLKGHVNLGSLRVRQDRMIFEGLAGTAKTGTGADDDPIELALDRIRQLSAHEIGHALGFAHNFAASPYKGSVMDYPAPYVKVGTDGALDFSQTYGVGIGSWDKHSATLLYGELSDSERETLISKARADGLLYVADSQARAIGTGHPHAAVWDNGADPVDTLDEVMKVRKIALENFGPDRLREGQPLSDLNKVIVPIYLYHRYQTAAAGKMIGGLNFAYGRRGDGTEPAQPVPPATQRKALEAVLNTLSPRVLDISDETVSYLTPGVASWTFADSDRELFKQTAKPAFDVVAAADTAAGLTFDVLLNPRRAARLVEFKRRDASALGFEEMLETTTRRVMQPTGSGRTGDIAQAVQSRFAYSLMDLAGSDASSAVQSRAHAALEDLQRLFNRRNSDHGRFMAAEIKRFLTRPAKAVTAAPAEKRLPPGSPIGSAGMMETCWHCE